MDPVLFAGVVDCAMDDEFWAKQGLEKLADARDVNAGAAPPAAIPGAGDYDTGFVEIGGMKIPKKVLYGLALGGLAGGAGGVGAGLDPKTMMLLAALGAGVGGLGGYGLQKVDENTPSSSMPGKSIVDEKQAKALADAAAAKRAANSGGAATVSDWRHGKPTTVTNDIAGTLGAQVLPGAIAGHFAQEIQRGRGLNKALASNDNHGVDEALGLGHVDPKDGKPPKPGSEPDPARYDELKRLRGEAQTAREFGANAPLGNGGRLGPKLFTTNPGASEFARMPLSAATSPRIAAAMRNKFQPVLSTKSMFRNSKGMALGGLAALIPSLFGSGPAASLVNHLSAPPATAP